VVIKINNQWGAQGDGNGWGRLATNTDVIKGLLWRIVNHPEGFTGEIVLAENTQEVRTNYWNDYPANAQDQGQSFQDVVDAFVGLGYPVSVFSWDALNDDLINGGSVNGGYPAGEYIQGNSDDAYILLEDPAGNGTNELSYPKFRTSRGTAISLRYGIWNGSSYDAERLALINLPVLKKHGMAGATISWKNYIGLLTIANHDSRFGSWEAMHGFFWGYQELGDTAYGAIGRQMALVRAADLNIVDAIWVATQDNTWGNAVRQNVLLASRDPFAVDWYASEYVLRPVVVEWPDESSAARGGSFRSATRANQNAAAANWPGGAYPYIDLLDSYNENTPSNAEKNQMNVYVTDGGSSEELLHIYLPLVVKAEAGPTLAGCPVFPADHIWNARADTLPVDRNSAAYINTIGATRGLHADFGSGTWEGFAIGIPFVVVPGSQAKVSVDFWWPDESDPGPYPIPPNPPIEGDPNGDGDRHILMLDKDNCILYELYAASYGSSGWEAGSGAIFDLRDYALRPAGWTSADAAGLAILPGLVRYDEVAAGAIRHAIRFTVPQTRSAYVWPARHEASSLTGSQYPPMGQRFRLKAGYDISGFSHDAQVILQAMKTYGIILADNGSAWYISGAPDERWDNDVLHEMDVVRGADFEAVDSSSLMLDPDSGKVKP
jgi:hypothetical protein